MNETILTLLGVLAVYGVSALAVPSGGQDTPDTNDVAALEETIPASPGDGDRDTSLI